MSGIMARFAVVEPRRHRATLAGASALLLCSCGTMNESQFQTIAIRTVGAPGAICTLSSPEWGEKQVVTPGTVTLRRGSHDIRVSCAKECFEDAESLIPANLSWGQGGAGMLAQGPVGAIADAATGVAFAYGYFTEIPMKPASCGSNRRREPGARRQAINPGSLY